MGGPGTTGPPLATALLCPDGPRVRLSGPAYMPSCMRSEVRLPLDQRILCSDCYKKMWATMTSPGSLLLFCTAQQQDTIGAYDQSYTFAQPAVQTTRWSVV